MCHKKIVNWNETIRTIQKELNSILFITGFVVCILYGGVQLFRFFNSNSLQFITLSGLLCQLWGVLPYPSPSPSDDHNHPCSPDHPGAQHPMQPGQPLLRASPGLQQWRHPGTDQPSAIGELNVYFCEVLSPWDRQMPANRSIPKAKVAQCVNCFGQLRQSFSWSKTPD